MTFKHGDLHTVHPAFFRDANIYPRDPETGDDDKSKPRGVWLCGAVIQGLSLSVANEILRIYRTNDIPAACRMGIGLLTQEAQQQQSDYLDSLI